MEELALQQPELIGREEEFNKLKHSLENAIDGKGSTILISGEAGIGKTRIVEEFQNHASEQGLKILSGGGVADILYPFLIFSKALESELDQPLFHEQEYISFASIFAVNRAGILVANASPEDETLDADIFSGMLAAVQDFVRDSFDNSREQKAGLSRLEYGDMKILIEHGQQIFLTVVFRGTEHPDMKNLLRSRIHAIEENYHDVLESWSGMMEDVAPIQQEISLLTSAKFLVRRDLEGVKLENERIRIADQILEILIEMARTKPLLFLLEDLHWAEESSLFVLNYVARNIKKEKILLIGTLRPEESETLQRSIREMMEEDIANVMKLEMLGRDSIASLIRDVYTPNEFPPTFVEHLTAQCEGNPFFVIEMLKQMYNEGNITKQNGNYLLVGEGYTIPDAVEDVVHRRLDMLEPDVMAIAEYLSCIGRTFEISVALSLKSVGDATIALEKLQNTGIVIAKDDSVEFNHAIFQEVIYGGIGARWKSAYHKSIGEYYENAFRNRLDEVLYSLAMHFSRTNEYEKAFDYCFRAGEKAENSFAPEQAKEFYEKAHDIITRLRPDAGIAEKEIVILERLGDIHMLIGEYENAIKSFHLVIEKEKEGQKKADIHRKIADVYERKSDYEKSEEECSKGLEHLKGKKCIERAGLLNTRGRIYMRTSDYDKAIKILFELLNTLKIIGNKKEMGHTYHTIGTAYWHNGDFDDSLKYLQKALKIREEIDDLVGLSGSLNNIGLVYWRKGELDKALEYYSQSLEILEKIGDKLIIGMSLSNIGLVYWDKGELDKSLEFQSRSLEIKKKIGAKRGIGDSLNNIGIVYMYKGELDKALRYYEQSLELREKIGNKTGIAYSFTNIAELFYYYDKMDRALEFYNKSLEICLETGEKTLLIPNYCGLARVNLEFGNIRIAVVHAEKAIDISIEVGVKLEEGISHRTMGIIYQKKKEWDKSIESFERAITILEKVGGKKELAETFYEYGLMWRAKSEPDKAKELLEKALSMSESMGMKLWEEKCIKACAELE
ncbi:MAG: tetratricopeptide repeat protein [Thermoplasmata archaeon]|nr:tetratricopeptide repeat protein [Thermoplasmata archaeon]